MEDSMRKKKRIYVDTSAVGGKFNTRLSEQTKSFWDAVDSDEIIVLISDMLIQEAMDENTPQRVRDFLGTLLESKAVRIAASKEANDLAARYIAENVVGESSLADCLHVALATLADADVLVSWNLKHLVKRSAGYKTVNRVAGYPEIEILTPEKYMEVHHDET
jgi:predicted nucleic acid-binding protein